jgi:hypothetical protein
LEALYQIALDMSLPPRAVCATSRMRGAERDKFFASDERRPDLFVRPGEETQQIPARWRRDFTPAHFSPRLYRAEMRPALWLIA